MKAKRVRTAWGWWSACAMLAIGCGSNGAPPSSSPAGPDAGTQAQDAPDEPREDVASLPPATSSRHVLLRAGAPAQLEPSLAIGGGELGVAMHASDHPGGNDWRLRFGVAPIQSDRTAGTFTFADLGEPAYAAHVDNAGASGFHVFWLTGQAAASLRYAAFDLHAQPLSQPVTVGAADEFATAAAPAGDSVGVAVRVAHPPPAMADEILVGMLTLATASPHPLASVEVCPSSSLSQRAASKPALAWSGTMLDVYYACSTQGPMGSAALRHVRMDAAGALVGPPSTVDPAVSPLTAPLAVSPTLYWSAVAGWTKGTIDPSSGAVSTTGPAGFFGDAQGVVNAREGTWALETGCRMGEDLPALGGPTACPWDAQGQRVSPCVTFSALGCPKGAIAGNGEAAFVAFEAGDDTWLLPLGAAPPAGADLRPTVIGRARTVKPRRVHCDTSSNCVVLVDEPALDIVVASSSFSYGTTGWTGWTEDPWRGGQSSSLAWYSVDGGASPTVAVVQWPQRFGAGPPVLADQVSASGAGVIAGGVFSLLGADGSVAWRASLGAPESAYVAFSEGDRFRLFRDEFPAAALGEYVLDSTGVLSMKTIASRAGDSPAWSNASLTACAGVYLATGPYVGATLRYDPTAAPAFSLWKQDRAPTLGCGGHLVGAIDPPTAIGSGLSPPLLSLWKDDGTDLASATLEGWSPTALAFASNSRGFAWLGWDVLDADAGSGSFDVLRVTASSFARGRLSSPPSVQSVVGLHAESTLPASLAAIYCDDVSGDCWLSNWSE